MKTSLSIACLACLSVLVSCSQRGAISQTEANAARPRVGVYDSRSIAIAFCGSEIYNTTNGKVLAQLKVDYKKAKAAGDTKRMAELEAKGKAQQTLLHKQGFSTAPVDEILAHIDDQVEKIAEDADVEVILSKWDKDALAKYKNAERVDVTMPLVDAFKPNERQRKSAIEIQKGDPISLKQAEKIDD